MSVVPPGQRAWTCPECGEEQLLAITRLDPLACEQCLERRKSAKETAKPAVLATATSTLSQVSPLVLIAASLLTGLVLGLAMGVLLGFALKPSGQPASTAARSTVSEAASQHEVDPRDFPPPKAGETRPGFVWVEGYTRKDGKTIKGYWRPAKNDR